MSTPYHHGNLREELVRQAVALAREKGEAGVIVREAARNAGVSHNAAYRHFKDRDALLIAVAQAGMAEMAARMRESAAKSVRGTAQQKAKARLRAIGRAYVEFALAEPGLFGIAFSEAAAGQPEQVEEVVAGPYELLSEALDGLVEAGVMTPKRRVNAEMLCWPAVHGFAALHLEGPLVMSSEAERSAALEDMLDQIQDGLTI
ncbi:MAG TPA: TetR/AcrR family transcriptional regulator [Marmoricola sp.]|nr:TetR/AcrR family transcriptional regulator [Marmoricola sp.]